MNASIDGARLVVAFVVLCCTCALAAERPNILFILADDLGYADTGFSGSQEIHTPVLDKLAREGAILDAFYVQPVCSPTRAALLTGRYPARTGVYHVVHPGAPWGLPLAERTLATALRNAGYETAICGKWHLGEFQPGYLPTKRGFDHQYGMWFGAADYFSRVRNGILDWHRDDQPCKEEGYSTHLLAKEACRIIREQKPKKPLFLYLSFNAVHAPHQVPDNYKAPYEKLSGVRRTYAGMVAAMDEAVGQVTAALEDKKLRENTLILFCSDNGGLRPGIVASNGVLRAGKGTIYEGGARSCAFVNWQGHIPAGQRLREPLHVVDWFPTLLNLAGGSLEQNLPIDGKDIWPVLTANAKSPHEAILLCGTQGPRQAAIRMGDWKLLVGADEPNAQEPAEADKRVSDRVELYNLAKDPSENNDLASAQPDKVKQLRHRLAQLTASAVPPGNQGARSRAAQKAPRSK